MVGDHNGACDQKAHEVSDHQAGQEYQEKGTWAALCLLEGFEENDEGDQIGCEAQSCEDGWEVGGADGGFEIERGGFDGEAERGAVAPWQDRAIHVGGWLQMAKRWNCRREEFHLPLLPQKQKEEKKLDFKTKDVWPGNIKNALKHATLLEGTKEKNMRKNLRWSSKLYDVNATAQKLHIQNAHTDTQWQRQHGSDVQSDTETEIDRERESWYILAGNAVIRTSLTETQQEINTHCHNQSMMVSLMICAQYCSRIHIAWDQLWSRMRGMCDTNEM